MRKSCLVIIIFLVAIPGAISQASSLNSPCSDAAILSRHLQQNPKAGFENEQNEIFTEEFIERLIQERSDDRGDEREAQYIIPVVLHVFHNGDDGKINMAQALSGIDILNTDFNGLNTDWNTIDPLFDSLKQTLDIQFCLATIDPDGNTTTGVNYYDDSLAMLNSGDLFQHAWDNYKYLNIYLPKYTGGAPSIFTAYAYYPSTANTNNNTDGVFYSSIRWGYGTHSELSPGQEWASVGTHELGHWLNLRHTFQNGCSTNNDLVDDTPQTMGGTIELTGCYNNDFSCGVATNGENYMDYNHDCKKMFTQGQVDRMTAALQLPSRINLWSQANLVSTGCAEPTGIHKYENSLSSVFPNPAQHHINFEFKVIPSSLTIYNIFGQLVYSEVDLNQTQKIDIRMFEKGVYFYQVNFDNSIEKGKLVIN